jgi:hypothetical protein
MNIERARRVFGWARPAARLFLVAVMALGSIACVGPGSESTTATASPLATLAIAASPTSTATPTASATATATPTATPTAAPTGTAGPTDEPKATPTEPPATEEPTSTPDPTEAKPAAPTTFSVKISSLPALVKPGANVTLTAVTSPGAKCSASVTYASGHLSTAKGLVPEPVAGASGKVSWTWLIGTSTGAGTSTATVTCSLGDDSAAASKD